MRQLLPHPRPAVELDDVYWADPLPEGRPWVAASMVSSVDGSATVAGRSGPLGGAPDLAVFRRLRRGADVILVGAGTARVEGYRPVGGERPTPIAVVSRSLDLDPGGTLFTGATAATLVLTCRTSDARRRAALAEVADVVVAGDDTVDVGAAIDELHRRGHRRVLCEGGPRLLADVVAADRLDELCLTIAPTLVGGAGPRIVDAPWSTPIGIHLASLLEEDGVLLARYRRG